MKFSKASYLFFFCASAVSALRYGERMDVRDVDVAQAEALAKRVDAASVPEVDFDIDDVLERREEAAQPGPEAKFEGDDEDDVADEDDSTAPVLDRRDPIKDAEKEIFNYLRDIKTSGSGGISGPASWPSAWSDLHGDNKSQYGGRYVCQVRKSGGKYEARVVAHANQGKNIKTGYVFKTVTVTACKDKKGKEVTPKYGMAVHFLRKAFGGPNPPACKK
jgi:hypothetical protein